MIRRFTLLCILIALFSLPALAQDSASCEAGFRPFDHAMGTTCIPDNPTRVVVLDTGELDNALALGANIVGAPVNDALQYQEYLVDQLDGIADIGAISTPNLEAILALQPDLILGSKQRYEAIYDQLSAIAPTVFTESLRVAWQTTFAVHAGALNRTAEADALLAAYNARVAEVRAALGDDLANTTISVIRFRPGQVRLYLKSSYIGFILQDVGLPRPASQDEDRFSAEISLEEVGAVDADYIFITGYAQGDSDLQRFLESPLWATLSAVQAGRAIDVNDDTWVAGLGVQSAMRVLDDLVRLLAPQSDSFPVTITHKFGETVIPAAPQRVVSIGYTEQDELLALGVTPLAVRYWYGEEDAILPWAEEYVVGDRPVVLNMPYGSLNYEAILALQPDLISAVTAGITQEEYDLLSQIAPTLTQTDDYINFGVPWQAVTRMIGSALGRSREAEALVEQVEGQFAAAREAHPQFAGKTVAVAYFYNGTFGFYTDQDSRARFFTELGFVVPQEMIDIAGDLFYADVSAERIDLLDQDLIVIINLQFIDGGRAALESDPLFSTLSAVREGRVLYLDETAENALGFSSPLSLTYALEAALPGLQSIFPAQ